MLINLYAKLRKKKILVSGVALILLLLLAGKLLILDILVVNAMHDKKRIITPWGEKLKSGNLSVDYTIEQALADIERLGLNTVNVPVEIDIPSLTSSAMTLNTDSEEKAIKLIKRLRYRGVNVILEPFPYIKNGELYETDLLPEDLNQWFYSWKDEVLGKLIKDIAKPYKVYALCIGSNFDKFETAQEYWLDVYAFARNQYQGKITYRTNWWYSAQWDEHNQAYKTKLANPLFGKVDFISVAAYFELTDNQENSVDNLVNSIRSTQIYDRKQDVYQELKNLSEVWKKPVFFGELGFPKRNRASAQPWNPLPSDQKNEQEQANCFAAYRTVFEKETWNLGFSVFAIGKQDEWKNYYPSAASSEVIKAWYTPTVKR